MAAPPDLASADWSVKQAETLNGEPKQIVWRFINALWGIDDVQPNMGKLCYFRFVNLRDSVELSLVTSYDAGGMADCNWVDVFDKVPHGIEDYKFPSQGPAAYSDDIKDINSSGSYELIVDEVFDSVSSPDHCIATWPVIYAWTGSGYGDVSSNFKHYYEQQLAVLQKRNAAAEAEKQRAQIAASAPAAPVWNCRPQAASGGESPAPAAPETRIGAGVSFDGVGVASICSPAPPPAMPEPDRLGLDCDKAEVAKLERFIGVSRDAGMSDAIKWANSENPHDREFAADVLADIGTPQAIEYLKTLSHDSNRAVAVNAKSSMQQLGKLSNPLTVTEQTIPFGALAPSSK